MPEFTGTLRTPRLASAPSSPVAGQMYFDTGTNVLYFWNGSTWVSAAGGGAGPTGYDTAPLGSVIAFSGRTFDSEWSLADGGSLPIATHADLHTWVQAEIAAGSTVWSISGANIVKPDYRDRFLYGGTLAQLNDAKAGAAAVTLTAAQSGLQDHVHYTYKNDSAGGAGGVVTDPTATGGAYATVTGVPGGARNASASHENLPPYVRTALLVKVRGVSISSGAIVGPKGDKGDAADPTTLDTWHTVGDATTGMGSTFSNGWMQYSASYTPLSFKKDPLGRVMLRGLATKSGNWIASETVFTLPAGYRPKDLSPVSNYIALGAESKGGTVSAQAQININPAGTVTIGERGGGANPVAWLSLDGIEFDTETVTTFPVGPRGPTGPSGSTSYQLPTARAATTANLNLAANAPATIDGVTLANGDLVLVWAQTNKVENGLYVFTSTGALLTRHSSAAAAVVLEAGTRVYVAEGTMLGARGFYVTTRTTVNTGQLTIAPPRGTTFSYQRTNGLGAQTDVPGWGVGNNGQTFFCGPVLAQHFITPPCNCEWEFYWHCRLTATAAGYAYAQVGPKLTPVDRDGVGGPYPNHNFELRQMHSGVQTYEPFQTRTTYRLLAGTAYQIDVIFLCNGGTFTLTTNKGEFWMESRAIVSA